MAKSLAPKKNGDLRDSIGWTWGNAPEGSMTIAAATRGELTITIYAGSNKAFYARWIEFGTQAHVIKAKDGKALGKDGRFGTEVDHPGSAQQPFFYPSYRANRKRAKSRLRRAVTKAAKKVAAE